MFKKDTRDFIHRLKSCDLARFFSIALLYISLSASIWAQDVAIKNNILYDAAATPNLSLEVKLAERWSLQFGAGLDPFPLKDSKQQKWRHVMTYIEPRYWFCDVFNRGYIAANVGYSHFNVSTEDKIYPVGWIYPSTKHYRKQGDAVMFGASYGWHFIVSKHISFELEAGIDAGHAWYDKFECKHCGKTLTENQKQWFAAPKAAVNLVVLLGGNNKEGHRDCGCDQIEEKPIAQVKDTIVEPVIEADTAQAVAPQDSIEQTLPTEPIDTVAAIAETIEQTEEQTEEQKPMPAAKKVRTSVFRPAEEYAPYTPQTVLSKDSDALYIHYDIGKYEINRTYMNNGEVLDSIVSILSEMLKDSTAEITTIQLVGMASFDGRKEWNEKLAQNRVEALKNYIQKRVSVPDSKFEKGNGGEGWAEVEWLIEHSDIEGKEQVIDIIHSEPDQEIREQKIKALNGGKTYRLMWQQIMKLQRNSGYIKVYYENKTK